VSHATDSDSAAPTSHSNDLVATNPESAALRRRRPQHEVQPELGQPSLGELKARHREGHLCFRCVHHVVCGMAKSLDLNLLVTIASCLAFEPEDSDDSSDVCELLPIEPLPGT
jgi:hypothetical protein